MSVFSILIYGRLIRVISYNIIVVIVLAILAVSDIVSIVKGFVKRRRLLYAMKVNKLMGLTIILPKVILTVIAVAIVYTQGFSNEVVDLREDLQQYSYYIDSAFRGSFITSEFCLEVLDKPELNVLKESFGKVPIAMTADTGSVPSITLTDIMDLSDESEGSLALYVLGVYGLIVLDRIWYTVVKRKDRKLIEES